MTSARDREQAPTEHVCLYYYGIEKVMMRKHECAGPMGTMRLKPRKAH